MPYFVLHPEKAEWIGHWVSQCGQSEDSTRGSHPFTHARVPVPLCPFLMLPRERYLWLILPELAQNGPGSHQVKVYFMAERFLKRAPLQTPTFPWLARAQQSHEKEVIWEC